MARQRFHKGLSALIIANVAAALLLLSCCGNPQCEPAADNEKTDVADALLPDAWADPAHATFRIILATSPYRVGETALDNLRDALSEQAHLNVEITEGQPTGLPATGVVDADELIQAGRAQIPAEGGADLVIIVVEETDYPDATYGFITYSYSPRPTAVMALHRKSFIDNAFGPATPELIEAATLLHEVGHWLGVPARRFHTSAIDNVHCTNARCVMFKGSRINACAILANVCTGVPLRFCSDCAEELEELHTRRKLATTTRPAE